jgi:hypothetical protein
MLGSSPLIVVRTFTCRIANCPSNQFFSRPGLALDQNDRIGGRYNSHSLQRRLKTGARSNQLALSDFCASLKRHTSVYSRSGLLIETE